MSRSRRARFRPESWDALEERVALSTVAPVTRMTLGEWSPSPAAIRAAHRQALAPPQDIPRMPRLPAAPRRPTAVLPPLQTPSVVIDQHYDAFRADISGAIDLYLTNLRDNPAAASDVGNQYLNYVSGRTLSLSRDLVSYFNRLPIRLPRVPGPYHTHRPETAIQFYLAHQIAGQGPQLLLQQLVSQPLPATPGPAAELYVASIENLIEGSRAQVREGVRLLFAGRGVLGVGRITPAIPGHP
jgi:hypothetical protein